MKPWKGLLLCAALLRSKRIELQRHFPEIADDLEAIEQRMRTEVARQRDKSSHMNAMDRKRLAWLESELVKPSNQRKTGKVLAVELKALVPAHLRAGKWPSESTVSRARRKLTA